MHTPPNHTYAATRVLCQGFLRTAAIVLLLAGLQHRLVGAVCPRSRFMPPGIVDPRPALACPSSHPYDATGLYGCKSGHYCCDTAGGERGSGHSCNGNNGACSTVPKIAVERSDPNSTCCVAAGQLPCTREAYARDGCTGTTCVPDYEFHGNGDWPEPYSGNVSLDSAVAPRMHSIGKGAFRRFRGRLSINGTGWTELGTIGDGAFRSIRSVNGAGGLVVFAGQSLGVLNRTIMRFRVPPPHVVCHAMVARGLIP
jgi:hypothetical protein